MAGDQEWHMEAWIPGTRATGPAHSQQHDHKRRFEVKTTCKIDAIDLVVAVKGRVGELGMSLLSLGVLLVVANEWCDGFLSLNELTNTLAVSPL